jgi:hypothetical protein
VSDKKERKKERKIVSYYIKFHNLDSFFRVKYLQDVMCLVTCLYFRNGVHPATWEIYFMVFQLRRKILSTRSHHETSPDEEVNVSVLLHGQSHSRERDEESSRGDDQVEDAGIKILLFIGLWKLLV